MIIWGYKTRMSKNGDDVLKNSCPGCKGDLELTDLKKWFTLYFIPIFPFQHIDTFYKCEKCEQTYKQEIKEMLKKNKPSKEIIDESKKQFAIILTACMTHMAKADGTIGKTEKEEIDNIAKQLPQFKTELKKVFDKVKDAKSDTYVMNLLKEATKTLTADGIMMVMGNVARVLLADGKIDKKEEALMKKFLKACDLSEVLYDIIIIKVKEAMKK